MLQCLLTAVCLLALSVPVSAEESKQQFPLFEYLTGKPAATMVTYTPSQPSMSGATSLAKRSDLRETQHD